MPVKRPTQAVAVVPSPACLRADHPDYPPLVPREGQELEVWGVVAGVVRKLP